MAIATHPATIQVVANGRRWGKTTTAGAVSLTVARFGAAAAWIVPTYRNSRPVWRMATRAAQPFVASGKAEISQSERIINFESGGWLGVYTADSPVGILGEAFDWVVVEEAARIAEDVWAETIMPTLADRNGRAMLISTPRGLNWFWREWLRGKDPAFRGQYASWQAPTSANPSPNIRRAAELAKGRLRDLVYRQEWEAEFLSMEGAVFRRIQEAVLRGAGKALAKADDGRRYVMGVDLGSVNDSTVVSVLDVTDAHPAQVYLDRFTGVGWQIQLDRIRQAVDGFRPDVVQVDRTGLGDMPFQELAASLPGVNIWGVQFNAGNKMDMVQQLALALERDEIDLLDDPVQSGEMVAYEAKQKPSGVWSYNAPGGGHDDTVSALMLANDAAHIRPWGVVNA